MPPAGNVAASGGGLCVQGAAAAVTLRRSRLVANNATGTPAGALTVDCSTPGSGGGACISADATVELSNSILVGNAAASGGGALVHLCDDASACRLGLNGMAFANNTAGAGGAGAGLYLAALAPAQQLTCAAPARQIAVVELAPASGAAAARQAAAAAAAAAGRATAVPAAGTNAMASADDMAATTTTFVTTAGAPVVVDGVTFQPTVTHDPPLNTGSGKGAASKSAAALHAASTTTFLSGPGAAAKAG